MRYRDLAVLAGCILAASCADRPTQPSSAAAPRFDQFPAAACPTVPSLNAQIEAVYPGGAERKTILAQVRAIGALVSRTSPPPDTAGARAQAFSLIQLLLNRYHQNVFVGGQSAASEAMAIQILNGILCIVGLPQAFGPGSLGSDGATAFIYPNTQDTNVVTGTQWAGVKVPTGTVNQPTIVTIQRLPDSPGPLLTQLDQYPIYYEYHASPVLPGNQFVTVAVCVASNYTPPDPSRLRLAHNVAPFTPGSIEILPLANAPFIDCSSAPIASAGRHGGFDLARIRARLRHGIEAILLPQPLLALPFYGVGGVGGTVKNFSPFGAVDTLATMTAASPTEFHGPLGGAADGLSSVVIRTPTGRPMVGIPVTFALTSGGGSLTGGSTATDVNGVATVGSWTLGPVKACSIMAAHATMTPGSGLSGDPTRFWGCAK